MAVIFTKTERGHAEITSRAGGLSPRVRRVLIFVDGKRTVAELRDMLLDTCGVGFGIFCIFAGCKIFSALWRRFAPRRFL